MKAACLGLIICGFASGTSFLDAQITVVQRSGPQTSAYVIQSNQVLGVTWTQNSVFSGVSIFATIGLGPDPGFAYLTNQIGPGTTAAANEIASGPFAFPATSTETLLFTGLTLSPGTYYLTLTTTSGHSAGWYGTNAPTVTAAPGVTLHSDYDTFTPAPYPPATNFNTTATTNLLFKVTAVPEPSAVALFLIGVAVIAAGFNAHRSTLNAQR